MMSSIHLPPRPRSTALPMIGLGLAVERHREDLQ
jgi:hypothetical protein